jgi:hypothetical protein
MAATSQNVIRFVSRPFVLRTFIIFVVFILLFHLSTPIQRHTDQYREKWGWTETTHKSHNNNPSYNEIYEPPWSEPSNHSSLTDQPTEAKEELDDCPSMPGLDRIVITVKTGATEALDRIPTLMATSLRCAPNVYVFSDMEEDIDNIHIYDALDTISDGIKDHRDFNLYRKQYELKAEGERIGKNLKGMRDVSCIFDIDSLSWD